MNMAGKNYYDVLGIKKTADDKEIKRAFRRLAKKYHPDTNPGNAEAEKRFKEVNEAYAVLGDTGKKALYDQYGEIGLQEGFDPKAYEAYRNAGFGSGFGGTSGAYGSGFGHGFAHGGDGSFHEVHFDGDLNDLFSGIFGNKGGGFSGFGGQSGSHGGSGFYGSGAGFGRKAGPVKGPDLTAPVQVSFEEAALGCDKMFTIAAPDGSGSRTSLQVHIPAGIDEGQKVRLKGKGNPGMNGGPSGDLLLEVHILPKAGYERKGQDIYVTVTIPFTTAALGGEAIVPTLSGKVACRIKAGTQSGSKIRLKGKGIVSTKNASDFGDEYVVIQIEVPKNLTPEQKKKLEEFEALTGQNTGRTGGRAA